MPEQMRGRFGAFIFILGAVSGGAEAMSTHGAGSDPCKVRGSEKLPISVADDLICGEIKGAMARVAPDVRYDVEVRVLSASRLSAVLIVNGKTLPEQNFSVSDRELGAGPVRRFAESLAALAAKH